MSSVNPSSTHLPTLPSVPINGANGHGTKLANFKAHELPNRLSNGRKEIAPRPTVRPEPKEFDTKVEKKGRAIVTMTLVSEAAYSRTMPTFSEGTPVKGRVRLNLDQPDTIHSVVISVSEHSFLL
jgi:hypothetical protein